MKALLVLIVLLQGGCAMTTHEVVETAIAHHVYVDTVNKAGSGIILQGGLVLTVAHIIEIGSPIRVDGKEAEIIQVVPEIDTMILSVDTHDLPQLKFNEAYKLLEPVVVIGNPLDIYGVVSIGRIVKIDIKKNLIYTDNIVMPGFSGGGAYTMDGELLGMIAAAKGGDFGTHLCMIIPIGVINDGLLGKPIKIEELQK
jgi:S1-C subfamily serine protease